MSKPSQDAKAEGLAPGTVIDGRYKVVRFIGEGGNGHVHEVEHILTGRRLALKALVESGNYGRLEQEARATSLMKNAHAVKVTDMGTAGPSGPYLVMELLDGQSLRRWLEDAGQLPVDLTVNVALQVCECLAEAHAHGIVHRDLKPENIFLCPAAAGQHDVKVLDFGVVKIASDGPIPNSSLTRTGSTVGTPYYMSLEQLRNSSNVDLRTDIYSLGVVVYECLAGRKPYQADTIGELVYALCSGPPTPVSRLRPDAPKDIAELVMRALASNRDERPATMAEFATALAPHGEPSLCVWLRGAQSGGARPARPTGRPPPPAAPSKPGLAPAETAKPSDKGLALPKPPRPEPVHDEGDRETPTEMYVKAVHHVPIPHSAVQHTGAGVAVGSGGARAERQSQPPPSPPSYRDEESSRTGDTPTRALQSLFRPDVGPSVPSNAQQDRQFDIESEEDRFDETRKMPSAGRMDEAMRESHPPMRPLEAPLPHMPMMQGGHVPPQQGMPMARAGMLVSPSPPGGLRIPPQRAKPSWQVPLDGALYLVGGFIERLVGGTTGWFRARSPRMQMLLTAVAASFAAGVVVLIVYVLLVRR